MLTFDEYQEKASETAIYPRERGIEYCAAGVANEGGEVAGVWKKMLRDSNGVVTDEVAAKFVKEIGDTLWYCAMLASELGYSLNSIAAANLVKLADRKERGVLKGSGDVR